jgi:hypothetical protein
LSITLGLTQLRNNDGILGHVAIDI